jgi:urease accessory protein
LRQDPVAEGSPRSAAGSGADQHRRRLDGRRPHELVYFRRAGRRGKCDHASLRTHLQDDGSRVEIADDGNLAFLPQETILFDRSSFERSLSADLTANARLLVVEPLVFGRQAMGEDVLAAHYRDRWRIRVDGRLVHSEDVAMDGDVQALLGHRAVTNGARAIATVLVIGSEVETQLDAVRTIIGDDGGASAWRVGGSGKLLARIVAPDSYELRKRLIPLIALLNGRAGLPKIWTT